MGVGHYPFWLSIIAATVARGLSRVGCAFAAMWMVVGDVALSFTAVNGLLGDKGPVLADVEIMEF